MNRELIYTITDSQMTSSPLTIHDFLKSRGCSHSLIVTLKKTREGITKNGVWAHIHDILIPGDCLKIRIVENTGSSNIVPRPLPFPVVYEDEDLIVIDKPADMPIHPSQGNYENTLANAAAWYFKQKDQDFVYRCINRLDRDTTGLLILAKHAYSASLLSGMVSSRLIRREYLAVVKGIPPRKGCIDAPIGRKDGSTIERQVDLVNGEPARTYYECLVSESGYSLVRLHLETGRTHQIRVHMNHIGHPLPGDFLYCPDYSKIRRQALHSYRLSFPHPLTGASLCFTSPLPADMCSFFTSTILDSVKDQNIRLQ